MNPSLDVGKEVVFISRDGKHTLRSAVTEMNVCFVGTNSMFITLYFGKRLSASTIDKANTWILSVHTIGTTYTLFDAHLVQCNNPK
jgi:hypothetical protein